MPNECELPDDVTLEEMAGAILAGRPIRRGNVSYRVELNMSDEEIEEMLAEAGIGLDDE